MHPSRWQQPVAQPGLLAASQPASQPAILTGCQSASHSYWLPVSQPGLLPVSQPAIPTGCQSKLAENSIGTYSGQNIGTNLVIKLLWSTGFPPSYFPSDMVLDETMLWAHFSVQCAVFCVQLGVCSLSVQCVVCSVLPAVCVVLYCGSLQLEFIEFRGKCAQCSAVHVQFVLCRFMVKWVSVKFAVCNVKYLL